MQEKTRKRFGPLLRVTVIDILGSVIFVDWLRSFQRTLRISVPGYFPVWPEIIFSTLLLTFYLVKRLGGNVNNLSI